MAELPEVIEPAWCLDVADMLRDHPGCDSLEDPDEAKVFVDKNMFQSLIEEINRTREGITDGTVAITTKGGRAACPLCPFRSLSARHRSATQCVLHHIRMYHCPREGAGLRLRLYAPGGTKHVKILKALWDSDAAGGRLGANLLSRCAALLREHVDGETLSHANSFDRGIVFVLTVDGPRFMLKAVADAAGEIRRCGYTYYTRGFAEAFLREMVLAHGRVKPTRARLLHAFITSGNELSFMLPKNVRTWLELLEDVMNSTCVRSIGIALVQECTAHEEWRFICMDATLRVAMRIKGQANYRAPAAVRQACVVKDDAALRRVLTVRGRTGAVLLTHLVRTEAAADIVEAVRSSVPKEAVDQVECVATDQPSGVLFQQLGEVLPNLRCLYLDAVHIVIVYNTAFWHKSTPGQIILRRMQAKFLKVDERVSSEKWDWGPYFTGFNAVCLSPAEIVLRSMVLDGSMGKHRAAAVLNSLEDGYPWYHRKDYIEAMAALSSVYASEMTRKTYMQSRTLAQILHAYLAPEKLEWLWNGARMRHSMPSAMVSLLGSGTSPNEALHAEINRWFRNQPEVFPSTLALQLEVGRLAKLLAHNAALYRPTLRQMSHDVVLAAAAAHLRLDATAWEEWNSDVKGARAARPLTWKRKALQARIRAAGLQKRVREEVTHVVHAAPRRRITCKRPAASSARDIVAVVKRPSANRTVKRTPFTLKRLHA